MQFENIGFSIEEEYLSIYLRKEMYKSEVLVFKNLYFNGRQGRDKERRESLLIVLIESCRQCYYVQGIESYLVVWVGNQGLFYVGGGNKCF